MLQLPDDILGHHDSVTGCLSFHSSPTPRHSLMLSGINLIAESYCRLLIKMYRDLPCFKLTSHLLRCTRAGGCSVGGCQCCLWMYAPNFQLALPVQQDLSFHGLGPHQSLLPCVPLVPRYFFGIGRLLPMDLALFCALRWSLVRHCCDEEVKDTSTSWHRRTIAALLQEDW